jgi:hypothetical protein
MITYIINTLCLSGFNLINSRVDAYRILKNKTIAHGINFVAYGLFSVILYLKTVKPSFTWCDFPWFDLFAYLVMAFCNRQDTFDIPLNLRRGLKWYYVSLDRPPKAWLDRQEVRIFGYNGKLPVLIYSIIWAVCIIVKILIQIYS